MIDLVPVERLPPGHNYWAFQLLDFCQTLKDERNGMTRMMGYNW